MLNNSGHVGAQVLIVVVVVLIVVVVLLLLLLLLLLMSTIVDTSAHRECLAVLKMSKEEIRAQNSAEVAEFDSSRKDSHIETFKNQATAE